MAVEMIAGAAEAVKGIKEAKKAKKSIDDAKNKLKKFETSAQRIAGVSGSATASARDSESSVESEGGEEQSWFSQRNFRYSKIGKLNPTKANGGGAKKGALVAIVLLIVLVGGLLIVAKTFSPSNLLNHLGNKIVSFATSLWEKAKNVFVELLGLGEVPDETVEALAAEGIEVGAVSSTGAFIQTNRVIASGSEYLIAANDGSSFQVQNGSLSVRFKGKVISADQVENELNDNPEFYQALYSAIEGRVNQYDATSENSAKKAAYDNLGVSDKLYDSLSYTGDHQADQSAFETTFADLVNGDNPSTTIGTVNGDTPEEGEESLPGGETNSAGKQAEEYIRKIAKDTSGDSIPEATEKAAALLNAAVSSNEPYYAARAYAGIREAIDLNKYGQTTAGPVNEAMNLLSYEETSKTTDLATGSSKEITGSAITAPNLRAVTSGDNYSSETAQGYSRDRAMITSSYLVSKKYPQNGSDCVNIDDVYDATNDTVVSIGKLIEKFLRWIASIISGRKTADEDLLVEATKESVSEALFTKPSESMKGQTLGERLVQGAAYFNTIESREVGASTASDKKAIASYNNMVQTVIAKKAEVDRATKSPFDASSPYTFLGSIVSSLQSFVNSDSLMAKVSSANAITARSIASLTTGVYAADGSDTYHTQYGDCLTENSIGGEGDMYCNESPTFDTSTFSMTLSELEGKVSSSLDSSGRIMDNTDAARYAILHTERESTPGVKDATVCQAAHSGSLLESIWNWLTGADSVANACNDNSIKDIATGKEYANTTENVKWDSDYKYLQGYFLETYVLDIFGYYGDDPCRENPVVAYKNSYYAKNPKDNSPEGILARRTGMSKEDVIAAIEAIRFLAYLNNYDPTTRFAFIDIPESKSIRIESRETSTSELIADDNRRAAHFTRPKYYSSRFIPGRERIYS